MRRLSSLAAIIALCAVPLLGGSAQAAQSVATAQITGSGSSWAQNAINQWISDVTSKGLQVVFTGSGSAQGRTDFRNRTTDFAVSDIGFQGFDQSTDTNDTNCQVASPKRSKCRPYVYLPIVAGGTTFPYQIRVAGHLVESLRLSGSTLVAIFTNHITKWSDPAIRKDNNGRFYLSNGNYVKSLPPIQIIPVVHSEGSGSTAQFTRYLATEYPGEWKAFSHGVGQTEYFPRQGAQVAENGSDGIINYVTSAAANGAIGYDEYSYALGKSCGQGCKGPWPVAQLRNSAGYFTAPTQYNVAVALTKAIINQNKSSPNYLLQNLNKVYTNPDIRTYPMSSYSYMIIPVSPNDPRMGRNAAPKAQTLADFIDWSICGGQAEMGPIGYSPLPINLAQASFAQMYKLHTADPKVQISKLNIATECHNPTLWHHHLNGNYLAHIAPNPPACDKVGQGPCPPGVGVGPLGNPHNGKAPTTGSTAPTSSSSSGSTNPSSGTSTSTSPGAVAPGGTTGSTAPGATNGGQQLVGSPVSLAESAGGGHPVLIAVLAAFEVLLLLALPPIIARSRRRGSGK